MSQMAAVINCKEITCIGIFYSVLFNRFQPYATNRTILENFCLYSRYRKQHRYVIHMFSENDTAHIHKLAKAGIWNQSRIIFSH